MDEDSLIDNYIEYSSTLSDIVDIESTIHNKRRLLSDLKETLLNKSDGSFGLNFSAHAFKQISERMEEIAMSSNLIYNDIYKEDDPSKSLIRPSNLKSFIITLLADARKKNLFKSESSKSNGTEYRYTIDMKKWSNDKTLQFIAIVENSKIKTCFFNWV